MSTINNKNYTQEVELKMGRSKKCIENVGEKFGLLLVTKYLGYYKKPSGTNTSLVEAICDCGSIRRYDIYLLTSGQAKSCGCYSNKSGAIKRTKHGCAKNNKDTAEYTTWLSMTQRCYNATNINFKHYGGRGIKICDRWRNKNGFENFLEDMGMRPSKKYSLDRIDVNGNYCPENCRWATMKQQANNKRSNSIHFLNGEKLTLSELSTKVNIKDSTLHYRINKWGLNKAINCPLGKSHLYNS